MRASIIAAVAIQALACLAWLLLENFEYGATRYLAWGSVPVGSAVAAFLAPPPRLVVGTFLGLPAVLLFPALHLVREWLGRESDYAGLPGALSIAMLTLPLCLILGLIGSGFGTALAWLSTRIRRGT